MIIKMYIRDMDKYYIDSKGNKYRVICIAKDADNNERIVCQALFGNGEYQVLPKESFGSKLTSQGKETYEYKAIKEKDALKDIPIFLNPQYHFPDIDYSNAMTSVSSPRDGVKGMISLLEKYESIKARGLFKENDNADSVEDRIHERINEYGSLDEEKLQDIFHLIQVWGGMTGRNIYIKDGGFNWGCIRQYYIKLVEGCLKEYDSNDIRIKELLPLIERFNDEVRNISVSFITKHTYFWLQKGDRKDPLPIYDSIMALEVMHKNEVKASDLANYWTAMLAKAKQLNIDVNLLERHIYKHARDNK